MDDKTREALTILQEEAAEVIQAVSKALRFGLENEHPKIGKCNRLVITQEVGDFLKLVDILMEQKVLSVWDLDRAKLIKEDRLREWSTLYE